MVNTTPKRSEKTCLPSLRPLDERIFTFGVIAIIPSSEGDDL